MATQSRRYKAKRVPAPTLSRLRASGRRYAIPGKKGAGLASARTLSLEKTGDNVMAQKKLIVLDPEIAFDEANRHWQRCKRCKNAGAERARLESLCARGRALTRAWEQVEKIY